MTKRMAEALKKLDNNIGTMNVNELNMMVVVVELIRHAKQTDRDLIKLLKVNEVMTPLLSEEILKRIDNKLDIM